MPVKFDKDRRWVEMDLLVPGTPEQVWHAMATGPGMSAWFTPTKVDERVGGEGLFDLGGGATSKGIITGWNPPIELTYEEHGWKGDNVPPVLTEICINARGGNQCVVRMVHSLFTALDTWDDELEGFEAGWPGFFGGGGGSNHQDLAKSPLSRYSSLHAPARAHLGFLWPTSTENRRASCNARE